MKDKKSIVQFGLAESLLATESILLKHDHRQMISLSGLWTKTHKDSGWN